METALYNHLRRLPLIISSSSISISTSTSSPPFSNRIIILNRRSHRLKLLLNTALIATMSEESNTKTQLAVESEPPSISKGEEAEKPPEQSAPIPLPPPPEKPLPGDCCGSGCVRCVWDIYYDELEDYNKLCKSNPNFNSEAKPS